MAIGFGGVLAAEEARFGGAVVVAVALQEGISRALGFVAIRVGAHFDAATSRIPRVDLSGEVVLAEKRLRHCRSEQVEGLVEASLASPRPTAFCRENGTGVVIPESTAPVLALAIDWREEALVGIGVASDFGSVSVDVMHRGAGSGAS